MPALALTAEAFLFTIALNPGSAFSARAISSLLGTLISFLCMSLMARARRSEVFDAGLLANFERSHHLDVVHGTEFRDTRKKRTEGGPLATVPAFKAWPVGLFMFGLANLATLAIAIVSPEILRR